MASKEEALRELARRELERRRSGGIGNTMADMGKSAVAGLSQGVTGLVDMVANAAQPPNTAQAMRDLTAMSQGQTVQQPPMAQPSRELAANLSGGATEYEPKTTAGEYSRTAGEFASNALSPGGLVRKAGMVVGPALASEGLGQLTKDTFLETPARILGGIVGGIGSAMTPTNWGKQATRIAKEAAKTAQFKTGEAMRQEIKKAYDGLRDAGVTYDAKKYSEMIMTAKQRIKTFPSSIAPKANKLLDQLAESPLLDFGDLDAQSSAVGKALRAALAGKDEVEAAALEIVKKSLDDFAVNPSIDPGLTKLDARQMREMRTAARAMVMRNKKAELVEGALEDARNYPGGFLNGLNNQIGSLLRNKRTSSMFTAAEKEMLRGTLTGKTPLHDLAVFGVDMAAGGFGGVATTIGTIGRLPGRVFNNPQLQRQAGNLPAALRNSQLGSVAAQQQQEQLDILRRRLLGTATAGNAALNDE
ncbi:hypothetical protein [Mesorhizobium sp. DCY119]|uniref:hypothetical protein n=1 Tax=Mesorhizobium sp. DCY119 TaxID=2108445 RepID=UPI000E6C7755|nr:hypothetical protein [Mesorhizobium sp. DCY119]RJG45871.1 hypothetical protein D3Y55_17510 [Mesorhizobium sp. DCY119]